MPMRPPIFRPANSLQPEAAQRDYDHRRGTPHARGYTKRLRAEMAKFKFSRPLCLGCEAVGHITATEVTDHIIPAKGDTGLLWDQENWQPACRWHHDIVKQKLEHLFAEGRIGAADLRLDSARAIALTKQTRRVAIGLDGWPIR